MTFVAGAHVFPGGTIDAADVFADAAACCDGLDAPPRFPYLDGAGAVSRAAVAATRELVEEAGVLLARRDEAWASSDEAEAVQRRLDEGVSFEQAVRDGGWRLALDALVPFAQIVTPSSEPRRFDTHFFLAELPSRGRGPTRRGGVRSARVGAGRPGARRRADGRARPSASDVADPDAARALRLGRRRARVGEGTPGRADSSRGSPQLREPGSSRFRSPGTRSASPSRKAAAGGPSRLLGMGRDSTTPTYQLTAEEPAEQPLGGATFVCPPV